jgi:hypothetical protein
VSTKNGAGYELPADMKRAMKHGITGIDALHGHLKLLMLEAEGNEERNPDDAYARGVLDTLSRMYRLTYAWAFTEQAAAHE